jgi:hypothetical protein
VSAACNTANGRVLAIEMLRTGFDSVGTPFTLTISVIPLTGRSSSPNVSGVPSSRSPMKNRLRSQPACVSRRENLMLEERYGCFRGLLYWQTMETGKQSWRTGNRARSPMRDEEVSWQNVTVAHLCSTDMNTTTPMVSPVRLPAENTLTGGAARSQNAAPSAL